VSRRTSRKWPSQACSLATPRSRRWSSSQDRHAAQRHQSARQQAEQQHRGAVERQQRVRPAALLGHRRSGVGGRLVEVHHLDDAQVVEGADQRDQHSEHRQPQVVRQVGGDQRLQHDQLGVEARGGRQPGEREHEDRHRPGHPRAALVEARQVADLLALEALARQQQDQAEGAVVST
jgi:hypothetical protein